MFSGDAFLPINIISFAFPHLFSGTYIIIIIFYIRIFDCMRQMQFVFEPIVRKVIFRSIRYTYVAATSREGRIIGMCLSVPLSVRPSYDSMFESGKIL